MRDESLSRLFPGAPSDLGTTRRDLDSVHSDILWSDGQGGGLQLNSVLPALLEAAYRLYVLDKKDTATEYLQYTKLILQQAQALARGDTVEVPYIVGLSNISLGSDEQLNLAFGRITPPDPSALRLITRGTQSIEQRISAVLHASFPLKLLDIKPWDPTQSSHTEEEEKLLSRLSEYRRAADRRIDLSRFALLLTSRETLIGTPIVLSAILLPVSQGSSFGVNIASNAPVPPVTLDGDMATEAESWSHKLAANQPHSLDVGMRRLLSAVTVRFDPADGLVDAVICWENMFGTAQETRFRVCGAMAKILEPASPAKRGQLNKELKRIYDVRSKLVHGSHKVPGPREAAGDRDKALLYALDSIRKLHGRPDLLAITGSADRSTTLLLDLAPAQKE